MKSVMVMAVSWDRLPTSCRVAWRACFGYHRTMLVERLGRCSRFGDAEMIAGRVEGAQAIPISWIAQPHAEHGLELVVARPNAPVVEAQRHGRDQFAGVRIRDLGRRIDADEARRKRDLFAR